MNNKFDPTKPVQTRDGRKARIICTDAKFVDGSTIAALVQNRGQVEDSVCTYHSDGIWSCGGQSDLDLINIPEPKKWRAWKPEEVPVEAWFKRDSSGICWLATFWDLKSYKPTIASGSGQHHSLDELLRDHKHSLDHGKTWQPCGILD